MVVPAAGRGLRMGSECPKQFLPLGGQPLVWHTLQVLLGHPQVAGVVLAMDPTEPLWDHHVWPGGERLLRCAGGAQRAESVLAGLRALPDAVAAEEPVLVHDAARPLLTHTELDHLCAVLDAGADGAVLAVPVSDSLKRADASGRIAASVAREGLWRALTPQAFRRAALTAALQAALDAGASPTDEAAAMSAIGVAATLVPGDPRNLKITTPADLALAAQLLQGRQS